MNREQLIDYVKRQLGYPTVNVELTVEQMSDAIDRAIDEIKPWYSVFKYLTIDVTSSCIDLSEYNVMEVTDVIKVMSADQRRSESVDPFSYQLSRFPVKSSYSGFSRINSYNHKIISQTAEIQRERFYDQLAMIIDNRTSGILYENISWKFYDGKLYIDTGHPSTSVVTIEYITNIKDVDDIEEGTQFMTYLQNLSVAFSQIILSRVTGKYSLSGSPSSINYQDMRSEANSEIDRIRTDLRKTVNTFYITD